jgi:hypothetical protein
MNKSLVPLVDVGGDVRDDTLAGDLEKNINLSAVNYMPRIKSSIVSRWYATPGIYDVIVYKDGVNYYAKDGRTGRVIYSSDDSESLLQYVLNKANDGDVIYIKDVVYADTLISRKKVTLTGPGAIYTKTGKLVRLLGNIEVKDLEVDFYTPRNMKNVFVEQFLDPNLPAWSKYVPSGGSVQVYQETKTVSGITFIERGVVLTGGSSDFTAIYKEFPLSYRKAKIIIQAVDLTASANEKRLFMIAVPGTTYPLSGALILKISTSGNLIVAYVNTSNTTTTIDTGVNIVSRPVLITLNMDNKNNYAEIYVDNKRFTITDWKTYPNLKYVALVGEMGSIAKFNLAYVELIGGNSMPVAVTLGLPDPYHPVGVSDSLGVYALGLMYPDVTTHVEIRDLKNDSLIRVVDLDETLRSDVHEYVYTRFVTESSKTYLYVILARHINNYTIYKIDTDSWNVVWKKSGNVATYNKLIWGWVTGLAVLYRDRNRSIAIDHIDPSNGDIVKTDVVVSAPGGYIVYGYVSPDWSGDGYLWLAWSNYDNSSGLRRDVYALAIDRNGVAYAPDGSKVGLPVSATDSKLLIERSDYSQPIVRPVREGAIVFRGGFYTPDAPSAFWLKKPGQVIRLELPTMPYIGAKLLVGRIPSIVILTYVSRLISSVLYNQQTHVSLLPINTEYRHLLAFIPAKDSRLLVSDGNNLYIYRTGFPAHYDGEIII